MRLFANLHMHAYTASQALVHTQGKLETELDTSH